MRDLPVLRGRVVVLRPWRPEDAPWYVAARDAEVLRWTAESPDLTPEDARRTIVGRGGSPAVAGFAVTGPDGSLWGSLSVSRTGPETVEVSYWMAPEGRGRGGATEAVRLAVAWAEQALAARVAEAVVHPDNLASRRVLEKAGFRMAGWRQSDACCAGADGTVLLYRAGSSG